MASDQFLDVLACPECWTALEREAEDRAGDLFVCSECCRAYPVADDVVDFVADHAVQRLTSSQRTMRFRPLTRVYERLWRPVFTRMLTGISHDEEVAWSLERLAPPPDATILDLACGPGNTTRAIAEHVPDGRVLGIDYSPPMLTQARRSHWEGSSQIGYARADAHRLPLMTGQIHGANCAGALYMFDDPAAVLAGLARVLEPEGMLTVMASRRPPALPPATDMVTRPAGLRLFGRVEMSAMLDKAGFDEVAAYEAGFMILLAARRR